MLGANERRAPPRVLPPSVRADDQIILLLLIIMIDACSNTIHSAASVIALLVSHLAGVPYRSVKAIHINSVL